MLWNDALEREGEELNAKHRDACKDQECVRGLVVWVDVQKEVHACHYSIPRLKNSNPNAQERYLISKTVNLSSRRLIKEFIFNCRLVRLLLLLC